MRGHPSGVRSGGGGLGERACNLEPGRKVEGDVLMWKEEREEQREQTPLKLLSLLRDLSPPRCESHMFGGEGGGSPTQ